MELRGRRVAVLVENYYQELEVWYPILRLREAGAQVAVVGAEAGATYKSKLGYPVKAEAGIEDVAADDFDAVVVPGGWAPDYMRRKRAFADLVAKAAGAGKPVGAICHGAWLLCSANVLKGRRATCFFSIRDDVIHAGAEYVDEEVVTDGPLVTSRTPDDLPAFCRAFIEAVAARRASSGSAAGSAAAGKTAKTAAKPDGQAG